MQITNQINDNIFRGYDIRGVAATDLTPDVAYTIGKAFGTKIKADNKTITVIGYDNRESSPFLFDALAEGILSTGIDVIDIGLVTTPMYYYALTLFNPGSGIMITASHNPKEDNGFKITFNGIYNAYGEYIQEFKDFIKTGNFVTNPRGNITKEDISGRYVDYLTSSISLGQRKPKIVVDCGNGTGSIIIDNIFRKLNLSFTPLFCESDPSFPNHHPDPSVEKNLTHLKAKVLELGADIGLALDGDADRIGVVTEKGEMLDIDKYMIIIIRDIMNKIENKTILYDVKCSKTLEDEIKRLGGTPYCYRTGNSYMRAKLFSDRISFAGELSGHIFFNDRFHGFDDGIYAGLRLIEILTHTNKNTTELLYGINEYCSTKENKITVTDDTKFKIIEDLIKYSQSKNYNVLTIDGCKVIFDDGFALIRASNTGPSITTRYEAINEDRLTQIQNEFETMLEQIKSRYL